MADQTLLGQVMALPLEDRVELAEALWESIGESPCSVGSADEIKDALRRDAELTSGQVAGRTHEQVMDAARRAIECD